MKLVVAMALAHSTELLAAENFVCNYLRPSGGQVSVASDQIQMALKRDCDLTKPFSASVVNGGLSYAAQVLYCCTVK